MNTILTTAEAAKLLKISKFTLNKWARHNQIPFILLDSGRRRFDSNEIQAWFASRKVSVKVGK